LGSDRSSYAVLGIAPDASIHEIRRSYRAAMKAVHPDVAPGREDEAKRLTAAYASLTAPAHRSDRDGSGRNARDSDEAFGAVLNICRKVVVWDLG
jgi:DnaJ-class molecular chaperone